MKHSLLIASLLAAMAAPAFADQAPTLCGEAATGKLLNGTTLTRTAAQATGMHVAADGYWTRCFPWIADGQPFDTPEPNPGKPCTKAGVVRWFDQDTGLTCQQPVRRDAYTRKPNQIMLATTTTSDKMFGVATWRCDPAGSGAWVPSGAMCKKR